MDGQWIHPVSLTQINCNQYIDNLDPNWILVSDFETYCTGFQKSPIIEIEYD